jgi:aspartyl protease family protein
VPIDSDHAVRQGTALEVVGNITGAFMPDMAKNQNFLHAMILTSVKKMRNLRALPFLVLLSISAPVAAVEKIALHALFKDKAILMVDGARRVLKTGESSPEGVKLVTVDTQAEKAEVEIDGKRRELRLGMVASSFAPVGRGTVTLYADRGGHYFAEGFINGAPTRFMVDTGATMVAMNSNTAKRIGLDYQRFGRAGIANTAGGMVRTYYLKLESVQVGEIKFFNVDAGVVEGAHPTDVLLGMSFLNRVDMKRDSEKLELKER